MVFPPKITNVRQCKNTLYILKQLQLFCLKELLCLCYNSKIVSRCMVNTVMVNTSDGQHRSELVACSQLLAMILAYNHISKRYRKHTFLRTKRSRFNPSWDVVL